MRGGVQFHRSEGRAAFSDDSIQTIDIPQTILKLASRKLNTLS
jgi:hypothetical protein